MNTGIRLLGILAIGWILARAVALPAPLLAELPVERQLEFNRDIRPILSNNCFPCHGFDARRRQAGLRLDTAGGAFTAAESGKTAVRPGDRDGSELWRRIQSNDPDVMMPPAESHKQLTETERRLFGQWIQQGAPYQEHWAFVPPVRPPLPNGNGETAIDRFIYSALVAQGLLPSAPTDRESLLRRLTLDLTGLPPSLEELDEFLLDEIPDAYDREVSRLLASPRYGERLAVFWLDLSRYGDTNGYLHDLMRTGWPWRDWVIMALNEDRPFDQFVIAQLAGDLLPSAAPQDILPTAFCRNHLITAEGGTLAAEYLNEYAADRVQTIATAFLGLSFNCCRCHDHKFDPLTQADFYSMQAYFNSITEKHLENDQSFAYSPWIEIGSPLRPAGEQAKVMVMQEAATPTPTFVLVRGQYDQPDKERPVARRSPGVFESLPEAPANRLGFAQWLVSPQNPLLARVTVNRLWQRIFGTGLVRTVDDFGVQGEYPSHPDLLDYLAEEFREGKVSGSSNSWSTKQLVRRILTSSTYRQSSVLRADLAEKDPGNRLLGRFPRKRLEAEEIRDQALAAAGLLSFTLGGPPVHPYQPAGLWEERANEGSNTKVFKRGDGESLFRRSLYTFWKRTCPPPLMNVFDAPDRTSCVALRVPTNTPLQALAMLNDEQFLECARWMAIHTLRETSADDQRLTNIFRRTTGRRPETSELSLIQQRLAELRIRYRQSPDDASGLLNQGTIASPPDLPQDELAAWMLIANALLNLDETLVRD